MENNNIENKIEPIPGVSLHKNNRWRVTIFIDGKKTHYGYYATVEEANKARLKAEEEKEMYLFVKFLLTPS